MDKLKYAAYGSNLHPVRLSERVPSARLLGTDTIEGWTLCFHKISRDGSGKCNIVRAVTRRVHIAVYEIETLDKPALDEIEAVGCGYRCEHIEVPEFGRCFTYFAEETHIDESLKPYTWYKALVLTGCETLEFPQSYIDFIRDTEAIEDPDNQRSARHQELLVRVNEYNKSGS